MPDIDPYEETRAYLSNAIADAIQEIDPAVDGHGLVTHARIAQRMRLSDSVADPAWSGPLARCSGDAGRACDGSPASLAEVAAIR